MNYIKQDLINEIAKTNHINKYEANEYVEMVFGGLVNIASRMKPKDSLKLSGLLHIEVIELNERMGTHPRTKEPITKPKKKFIRAKLGSRFVQVVK